MFTEEKKTAAFVLQADETLLWAERRHPRWDRKKWGFLTQCHKMEPRQGRQKVTQRADKTLSVARFGALMFFFFYRGLRALTRSYPRLVFLRPCRG